MQRRNSFLNIFMLIMVLVVAGFAISLFVGVLSRLDNLQRLLFCSFFYPTLRGLPLETLPKKKSVGQI